MWTSTRTKRETKGEKVMRGKLIVIEGTDCSGKETQTNLLMNELTKLGMRVEKFSFPNYQSPTGRIIGGPYLGKSYIGDSWFNEGATKVDPKVAALYYAADRKYNIYKITFLLENGVNVILDRYVYSNMAHQGGKIANSVERQKLYTWLETLEFDLLELPHADIKIFLHMPFEQSTILKQNREETPDEHEKDAKHLKSAEFAYLELADKYSFKTIECASNDKIKSIDEIHKELMDYLLDKLKK